MTELTRTDLVLSRCFIGGAWVESASKEVLEVTDPATGALIGSVPNCGIAETEQAIKAAATALPGWRSKPASDRAVLLERWHLLVHRHAPDLAWIMTSEQGKPLKESLGEIYYAASFIKWFAEEGRRVYGRDVPSPSQDRRILIRQESVGVCAAITPWNFPSAMITRKAAAALAAGCTMVIKPSELTPLSAFALARLAEEAGLPPGVLNVVTGAADRIGEHLTASAVVRKLSFTGSTRVGAQLMRQCASTIKNVSLELGGNAPFIVFEDANLDLAVAGAMASKFRNAGQTCVCANRFLVHTAVLEAFVAKLAVAVRALQVGPGMQDGTHIGPLISVAACKKVLGHVDDALKKGARIAASAAAPKGQYVEPMILVDARADMLVALEETFGPIAPVLTFDREEDAVNIANATPFGLAAYFYTNDINRAWRVGEALEFGMVGLNTGSIAMEMAPFGGVKQSGLGREGGSEGIEAYLEPKAFHWGGLTG